MNAIQTLLTEHIDIWTDADIEKKSGRGRSSGNAASVYGIKKLRELILELAVRGKLVPQDENDEPAHELLKRIQAEKKQLITEGRVKKDQPIAAITEDEKSFELPQRWEWVRLGQAVEVLDSLRKPVTQQDRQPGPYPYYGASGVVDYVSNYLFDEPLVLVGEDGAKWGRGENTAFKISGKTWVNNHAHVIRPYRSALLDDFVTLSLNAMDLGAFITGMTVPKLNQARLVSIVLPLPPLLEQHRIVAKVDELMALCDQLETQHRNSAVAHEKLVSHLLGTLTQSQNAEDFSANWQRIAAHFDTLFTTEASIDALKQTLLQMAVTGFYTSDMKFRPADMFNAKFEDLLEKSVGSLRRGPFGSSIRKDMFVSTGYKVYEQKNAIRGDCDLGDYYISKSKFEELSNFSVSPGDFIVSCAGTIGKISLLPVGSKEGVINQALMRIRTENEVVINDFFIRLFESPYFQASILETTKGSAMKNLAAVKTIKKIKIWLPSIIEQHRIVAKVDELMALCDQLKTRITQANQLQQKLADVLVEQAAA